ncbi:hypothetical protein DRW03_23490 [Corallococcus sp. H22C18031201]|uniref:hypothetical protein n=1 Tax=Citreicoccus inhibens TaxID=2849499 RepID=UPI000E72AAEB|nr:hypothetical protein [Citreicoccus inhibens]MBU8897640.1 hypothetical protein [Citreicoccus inhibens]RJS19315.1 hypothetical protein DRW03_23490 [Corallococcus sp. H22C18031201]
MLRKSLLCAALLFAGCDSASKNDEESFKDGLPAKEMVDVKSPGTTGQGLTSASASGQTSEYYQLTLAATATVNGGTRWVLDLIADITVNAPSSISDTQAVWGPFTGALSPTTYKLTVTKTGDLTYSWVLEGKAKSDADSGYKVVLSGSQTVVLDATGHRARGYGSGSILIDWDVARTLPNGNQKDLGTAEIDYSRLSDTSGTTVDAHFRKVRDNDSQDVRVDADYHYKATPGAGGEFDYVLNKNIDIDPTRTKLEQLAIKSRWANLGNGRTDIKLSGGDLSGQATVSECWNTDFKSTYFRFSLELAARYGTEAADCGAFTSPVYSSP